MDPLAYMLMSKSTGNIMYDIMLIVLVLPLIGILVDKSKISITNNLNKYFSDKKTKSLDFVGWENIIYGTYSFDFPIPMLAICYHLIKNNKAKTTRFFNKSMNGCNSRWDPIVHNKDMHFIISSFQDIIYDKYLTINFSNDRISEQNDKNPTSTWKIILKLSSTNDLEYITDFVNNCMKEYESYITENNKDKIYHFIFQGKDDKNEKYLWKTSILSDLNNDSNKNFESFDTMFFNYKQKLINDIKRLKDLDYYKKTGSKRKKGYLFYGPPGCGKTSSVIAMANYDKRHIIEIPMSRVKTNADIEEILNLQCIGNINFKKEEIILLFDEIDTGLDALQKRESEKDSDNEEDVKDTILKSLVSKDSPLEKDKICLGTILSRLDGVGSYNGIIIIATTNCIDKISPAVYRHGRLNPMYFDHMTKENIEEMINYFYNTKLTDSQLINLPSHSDKISPSSMRQYIEDHMDNLDSLLQFLKTQQK